MSWIGMWPFKAAEVEELGILDLSYWRFLAQNWDSQQGLDQMKIIQKNVSSKFYFKGFYMCV